jgi:hypothetical protein
LGAKTLPNGLGCKARGVEVVEKKTFIFGCQFKSEDIKNHIKLDL